MEAKTKIMAAVAVIVMCAAGLVGAGYAYTASTTNDGNSASSEYITLVQGGTGAYDFADGQEIYWDATDKKLRANDPLITGSKSDYQGTALAVDDIVTVYKLDDVVDDTTIDGYTVVKIGDSFTLNPVFTGETIPEISIDIAAAQDSFPMPTAPANAAIWMVVNDDAPSTQYFKLTAADTFTKYTNPSTSGTGSSIDVSINAGAYRPLTVSFYYGFEDEDYADGFIVKHADDAQPNPKPQTTIFDGAKLTFTIDVDKANELHFSIAAGEVANSGTLNLAEKLVKPTGWEAVQVTWESSNTTLANVSNVGVVTGAESGTGNVTITASMTNNEITVTTSIVVTVGA